MLQSSFLTLIYLSVGIRYDRTVTEKEESVDGTSERDHAQ